MPYPNFDDETLVMLTLAGEQDAYEALVLRHQNTVIASAMSVTHSRFMAEDAAQDAFVSAWMKLDTLISPDKFGAWVCRIAKNCAVNMLSRYRSFLPLDTVENYPISHDASPEAQIERREDSLMLHTTMEGLPEKVKEIIRLHYFEGLSIAEIADRMRISTGTVKSQLHTGRRRMRKELCAMDEKFNDTLCEKVMKKVAELKLWRLRENKDGFEAVYRDVLRDVEELPESCKKYHALADVLMHGWWWLAGEKNDALFARIKEAAELGKNEDVMRFIVAREDEKVAGTCKIEFIREKQIPYLERLGFVKTLAFELLWLGHHCIADKKYDEGFAALERACTVLPMGDPYRVLIENYKKLSERVRGEFSKQSKYRYGLITSLIELRNIDGKLCYWSGNKMNTGWIFGIDHHINAMLPAASRCDGRFFGDTGNLGECITATDGTTLTLESTCERVETPCGVFDDCVLWVTRHFDKYVGKRRYKLYYKDGVGIVKFESSDGSVSDTRVLSSYKIAGGTGLFPLAVGNEWVYADTYDHRYMRSELCCKVVHAEGDRFTLSAGSMMERIGYNEDSWLDMIQMIRCEYHNHGEGGDCKLNDVSHAMERAEALAVTPMEKAHTRVAVDVARRIMDTDNGLNPDCSADGMWNFFNKNTVKKTADGVVAINDYRWSFEWKNCAVGSDVLCCNHIYGILQGAGKYLWSDEWKPGMAAAVEYLYYGTPLKNTISCTEAGTVTTKAGTFEGCIKLAFNITGMKKGMGYRGGDKDYYFAPGVGIVRVVNHLMDGYLNAVYELASYTGTGEGYMPICDGMVRKYECMDFADGYYGAAEYTYIADDDGDIVIFANKTGVKNKLPPISS